MTTERRWLPREGFHADVLGRILRNTLLNPTLTLPALAALRFTDKGRELASRSPQIFPLAAWLAGLGTVRAFNAWLGDRVMNNATTDKYDWAREVVIVTGGSDGIGKRIVQMLAARAVKTVILDVQEPTFQLPSNVTFFKCDITSSDVIADTKQKIQAAVGTPTVLVNNAGVCRGKPLLQTTDADLDLTFGVNSISHYKLARAFVPAMITANHGMVVTVASTAAFVTAPRMTEYAASKCAASAFHEGLSAELAVDAPRVRTVLVNQGYTRTSLFQGFGTSEDAFFSPALHVDTVAEAIVDQIMAGRSAQLIMPGASKLLVANFRSLPNWMQYNGRRKLTHLMQNWSGRQVTKDTSV